MIKLCSSAGGVIQRGYLMFPSLLKTVILKSLNALGFEMHRSSSRSSLTGVLRQPKNIGLLPNTVIDVGAAYGGCVSR